MQRARIVLPGGHSTLGCVIHNLSDGGAKLQTEEWVLMPEFFTLRIEGGPNWHAMVCYRDRDCAGVRFMGQRAA
jgi:hypothetical protein